jgi:hypothetical protein
LLQHAEQLFGAALLGLESMHELEHVLLRHDIFRHRGSLAEEVKYDGRTFVALLAVQISSADCRILEAPPAQPGWESDVAHRTSAQAASMRAAGQDFEDARQEHGPTGCALARAGMAGEAGSLGRGWLAGQLNDLCA